MIIGTRESALAMAQAEEFKARIEKARPDIMCQIKGITSTGDVDTSTHLKDMGGTGVFVRELDDALLNGEIDVTVNSLKDIPAKIDPRLTVAAVLPRADPRDALIPLSLGDLSCGAIVGTSSVRREMMLRALKPSVRTKTIRGNMNTRLSKLETEEYTAILMAKAGLDRLGITTNVHPIEKHLFVPAAGQGAIAVECRADDTETIEMLKSVDDAKTRTEVTAERDILRYMDAGCSSPIGINAEIMDDGNVRLIAVSFVNIVPVRIDTVFPVSQIGEKTIEIAEKLLGRK